MKLWMKIHWGKKLSCSLWMTNINEFLCFRYFSYIFYNTGYIIVNKMVQIILPILKFVTVSIRIFCTPIIPNPNIVSSISKLIRQTVLSLLNYDIHIFMKEPWHRTIKQSMLNDNRRILFLSLIFVLKLRLVI